MKFYGHADLRQNEVQNMALHIDTSFPESPVVGQLIFKSSVVYICVDISNNLPIWVPMTREITAYTHTQTNASSTWSITHNLNTVSIHTQVFDANNRIFIPDDIQVIDSNHVVITLSAASTGRAVLLSGTIVSGFQQDYSYTHFQSDASTSWVIDHNLGYAPIVRVFVGNQEVQPLSIIHNTVNRTTITFNTAYAGFARLI